MTEQRGPGSAWFGAGEQRGVGDERSTETAYEQIADSEVYWPFLEGDLRTVAGIAKTERGSK